MLNVVRSNIFLMCLFGFLFTLHAALPSYITSTFLSGLVGERSVGIFYTIAAILTIVVFSKLPAFLKRRGNYRLALWLVFFDLFSSLGLALFQTPLFIGLCFFVNFVSIAAIGLTIDIFLESFSTDEKTGRIRGVFNTSANAAWIIAPLLNKGILTDSNYWSVYLASAVLLTPVILLIHGHFKNFKDKEYYSTPLVTTIKYILSKKNIKYIFFINYLLQFFFAWMVIYTPIYLHQHIGFEWNVINTIFSVMLLPFVLTELPLGKLADTRWGEKEILSLGFVIMAISTGFISYFTDHNFGFWLIILFATRVGASMVEIMSETYFFKQIDEIDANIIDLFRTLRPWAYVTGPLIATGLLYFMPFQYLFIVLGIIMLLGLRQSLLLEDTR